MPFKNSLEKRIALRALDERLLKAEVGSVIFNC